MARDQLAKEEIEGYYEFCGLLLQEARALVLKMLDAQIRTDTKADASFVTEVDLAVEQLFRDRVQAAYPTHGFLGEELPTIRPDAELMWVCDPIDGTQNLVHRLPTFGCILGLQYRGQALVGGIDHPLLNLCYRAGYGLGAYENGERLQIVDERHARLDQNEIVALATRAMFERSGEGERFDHFMRQHPSTRVFYDCFSTTRVVAGQVGALAEFNVRRWDLAATEILVTEAGGVYEEIRVVEQPEGKEPLRSVLIGKPSVVAHIRSYFV